jgi:hypothetical protein
VPGGDKQVSQLPLESIAIGTTGLGPKKTKTKQNQNQNQDNLKTKKNLA